MKIALHDHEKNGYPNLALMKLSAWHKNQNDSVEWFDPLLGTYDKIYSSKIFTWTKTDTYLPKGTEIGGTGFDLTKKLPEEIEHTCPDYSIYDCGKSYGFLTRGCIRNCKWCFVPKKEGQIKKHADIKEFARHKEIILMDNNVLAHEHGIHQIEKIIKLGLKVDFNQGLDARLIDDSIAKLLSKVKWLAPIRLACDTVDMIEPIRTAVELLRWHNTTPTRFFCYTLVQGIEDALERVKFLKGINVDPFCQPYRDKKGTVASDIQKRFSRWVNHKAIFKSVPWSEYGASKSMHGCRQTQ